MRYKIATKANMLAILAILIILAGAYVTEFTLHEPPCPLCLLQRFGFLTISYGFLLNIKYGIEMQHYGLSLCGALFTAAVATRQILLHIFTTSGVYGSALFGLHLYTWSFIAAVGFMIFIAFELIFSHQLQYIERMLPKWVENIAAGMFALTILFALANVVTTFLLCGFDECPENPATYKYLISLVNVPNNFVFCS